MEKQNLLDLYRPADKKTYYHTKIYLEPADARKLHCRLPSKLKQHMQYVYVAI